MIKRITPYLLFVLLSGLTHFSNAQDTTTFSYTGTMQTFTIPANSYITIDVYGAAGGTNDYSSPGYGARMTGTFTGLSTGKVLKILVGGQGGYSAFTAGGGGGSFVVDSATNTPLIIAGGGAGAYWWGGGGNGVTSANGMAGLNGNPGGSNGSGGAATNCGGGGGGFTGNGVGSVCSADTNGGQSFINGGAGGSGNCFQGYDGAGGYGGGGDGAMLDGNITDGGSGGGGGYSGGGGGSGGGECKGAGGGGGSYNTGINPIDSAGVNSADGLVVITIYTTGTVQPNTTFNYTGAMQTFKVPANSYIRVDAFGAQGGATSYSASGNGARMSGTFMNVTTGQVLNILVGGQGGSSTFAAGGGGGSFVVDSATNTPLIIAGGGGGDYWWDGASDADTSTSGTMSHNGNVGGMNGSGGAADSCGAGGGGFFGNGAGNICPIDSNGGKAFVRGGAGGAGDCSTDCSSAGAYGGYGGGGVGTTANAGGGGGGGGYSGGGGGSNGMGGGGGASYNAGTDQADSVAIQTGNGQVVITVYPILTGVQPLKSEYTSFKVYPNPVSNIATFDYVLTSSASVTLDIYSTLGQKISLLNNDLQSTGKHSLQWNVKDKVAAGVYNYRIQIGESQKAGLLVVQQ